MGVQTPVGLGLLLGLLRYGKAPKTAFRLPGLIRKRKRADPWLAYQACALTKLSYGPAAGRAERLPTQIGTRRSPGGKRYVNRS